GPTRNRSARTSASANWIASQEDRTRPFEPAIHPHRAMGRLSLHGRVDGQVRLTRLLLLVGIALLLFVAEQAVATLQTLPRIEAERDTWQRPSEIVRSLDLHLGNVVIDFGSGAGYFALKLAPVVGPNGRVLAVDL